MGKILILFGIGAAMFASSVLLILSGWASYSSGSMFYLILPTAVGLCLMMLGVRYGMRKFDRYMDSD